MKYSSLLIISNDLCDLPEMSSYTVEKNSYNLSSNRFLLSSELKMHSH